MGRNRKIKAFKDYIHGVLNQNNPDRKYTKEDILDILYNAEDHIYDSVKP